MLIPLTRKPIPPPLIIILLLVALALLALALTACASPPAGPPIPREAERARTTNPVPHAPPDECRRLVVIMLGDTSGSPQYTMIPRLTVGHVERAVEIVSNAGGGEVAVGAVDALGDESLLRLRLPRVAHVPFEEPPRDTNPHRLRVARREYEARRADLEAAVLGEQQARAAAIDEFLRTVDVLLTGPVAARSDVWGPLGRAAAMAGESPSGCEPPLRAVIAATDFAHNIGPAVPVTFPEGTLIVAVVGARTDLAPIGGLAPVRVESIDAALDLVSRAGGSP